MRCRRGRRWWRDFGQRAAFLFVVLDPNRTGHFEAMAGEQIGRGAGASGMVRDGHDTAIFGDIGQTAFEILGLNAEINGQTADLRQFVGPPNVNDEQAFRLGQQSINFCSLELRRFVLVFGSWRLCGGWGGGKRVRSTRYRRREKDRHCGVSQKFTHCHCYLCLPIVLGLGDKRRPGYVSFGRSPDEHRRIRWCVARPASRRLRHSGAWYRC